jgi:hypothetical protein
MKHRYTASVVFLCATTLCLTGCNSSQKEQEGQRLAEIYRKYAALIKQSGEKLEKVPRHVTARQALVEMAGIIDGHVLGLNALDSQLEASAPYLVFSREYHEFTSTISSESAILRFQVRLMRSDMPALKVFEQMSKSDDDLRKMRRNLRGSISSMRQKMVD